jgi:hypothetical protein
MWVWMSFAGFLMCWVGKKPAAKRFDESEVAKPDSHGLMPQNFAKASFVDGSRARVVDWGKAPK